jgi:DNA polymerase III subunit delta
MRSALLNREIREENLSAGYFFHGEEFFQAHQFIRDLRRELASPDDQDVDLERFSLSVTPWRDILDVARTMPFFFSPWRLLIVEIEDDKKDHKKEDKREDLTAPEMKILKEYFAAPAPKTILIVLFAGKIRKTKPLYKVFSSLPPSAVVVKELKALKSDALFAWVEAKATALGKQISSEAIDRLIEVTSSDLYRLDNELEKLATYAADKKLIEETDVNLLSAGLKDFDNWELTNCMEKADFEKSLTVLNSLFAENCKPQYILGILAGFLRDILLAKTWLREKKDRREIFRELRPQISETWGSLYRTKFNDLFDLVERFSMKEINFLIAQLGQIDLKIKTGDGSAQVLFEAFISEFCRLRK